MQKLEAFQVGFGVGRIGRVVERDRKVETRREREEKNAGNPYWFI